MNKMMALILAMGLSAVVHAETFNPIKGSYGHWVSEDKRTEITITPKGIDGIYNAPKNCRKKPYFGHEKTQIKGKALLAKMKQDIDDNAYFESNEERKTHFQALAKLIDPKKTYTKFIGFLSCADGAEGFIFINERVSLGVMSAPDDFYYKLIKK